MNKKLVVAAITAVFAVCGVVASVWFFRRPLVSSVSSAAPSASASAAPPTKASAEEIAAFEKLIAEGMAKLPPAPKQESLGEKLAVRIKAMRERASSQDCPSTLWQSNEVYRLLGHVGDKEFPTVASESSGKRSDDALVFSARTSSIQVWPRVLEDPDERVEQLMIHMATRAVVEREFVRLTGLKTDEVAALREWCSDLGVEFRFASDALALRNEALWLSRLHERLNRSPDVGKDVMLNAALKSERGTPDGRLSFARALNAYRAKTPAAPGTAAQKCGRLILTKGPRRGEFVSPMDIASEILRPLWELAK